MGGRLARLAVNVGEGGEGGEGETLGWTWTDEDADGHWNSTRNAKQERDQKRQEHPTLLTSHRIPNPVRAHLAPPNPSRRQTPNFPPPKSNDKLWNKSSTRPSHARQPLQTMDPCHHHHSPRHASRLRPRTGAYLPHPSALSSRCFQRRRQADDKRGLRHRSPCRHRHPAVQHSRHKPANGRHTCVGDPLGLTARHLPTINTPPGTSLCLVGNVPSTQTPCNAVIPPPHHR